MKILEINKINVVADRPEKSGYPIGTVRFYIANILLGMAVPTRITNKELFRFDECSSLVSYDGIGLPPRTNFTIEEITQLLEEIIKNLSDKIFKTKKTFKPVKA